jgi:hypothetical protein
VVIHLEGTLQFFSQTFIRLLFAEFLRSLGLSNLTTMRQLNGAISRFYLRCNTSFSRSIIMQMIPFDGLL